MIIELIDNFYIEADSRSYTLREKTGKKDKKGKPYIRTHGYFGSLPQAVLKVARVKTIDSADRMTLKEYVENFESVKEEIEEILDIVEE